MRNKIFYWAIVVLPIILCAIFYGYLPEQIVMNWGFDGSVRYDEKYQLWLMSGLSLVLAILFRYLPVIDPRKKNYEKFMKQYEIIKYVVALILLVTTALIIINALCPNGFNIPQVVMVLVSVTFIIMGNIMPKIKSSYFVGFRTPWTIANDEVWYKTNRLAGKLMFGGGVVNLICAFILSDTALFAIFMTLVALIVIVPTVMSYVWYRDVDIQDK